MRLAIGTNFDDNLFEQIKGLPVSVIYGKLTGDIVGGGRPSFALPKVDEDKIKHHIELAHENGIEFNYLLNSVCMDNLELTKDMNAQIIKLLDKLKEWKVDWVTVTLPYLIDLVKKHLPNVKISVSAFAYINSIQKAKHYEELGVDEITLPESFNRNFKFLKQLRKSVSIDIRLIATNDCIFSCPYQCIHPIYQSHASQENHISEGYPFDYCLLKCTYEKLKDPVEYIKSCWIRPEDLKIYKELGYDTYKLTERLKNTDKIVKMVRAYAEEKWDGNLAEILNVKMSQEDFVLPDFEYINKPEFCDVGKFNNTFNLLFTNQIYIDNQKLDGFLDYFLKKNFDCQQHDCRECGYCDKVAAKVVSVITDESTRKKYEDKFEHLFEELTNGEFFKEDKISMEWSEEVLKIFEKMIQMKPDFIREHSRNVMKIDAENIAKDRDSNEVSVDDIVEANFNSTPDEVKPMMIQGLLELGLDISKFMKEVRL